MKSDMGGMDDIHREHRRAVDSFDKNFSLALKAGIIIAGVGAVGFMALIITAIYLAIKNG